ncbi:restriction endonuclease subunit M [Chamaesiphon minutus]|uniref:site-specific DNA-methyltransferase (cytosine-N(4)-specific) n=1 Tax=Chamaesiphon minutus (strain ATCC 27169 / PCC 6605) TaxID=1173020 RepID=K9UCG1_CHAP6|nr:restriction endonuclease subunit M [Chamaesiphon minutus]AFY92308.1 DNA modification methylase [Chamaesiphon minutus PCC 6605]
MTLPNPLYTTDYGTAYVGDSLLLLDRLEPDSIDLVLTSPPFALQRKKTYGNVEQEDYVEWLLEFCQKVYRVLSPTGSFVLDLKVRLESYLTCIANRTNSKYVF